MPMVTQFLFRFNDLDIDKNKIHLMLGYEKSAVPELIKDMVDQAYLECHNLSDIEAAFQVYDEFILDNENFRLSVDSSLFHLGPAVCAELSGMEKTALVVSTAGKSISDMATDFCHHENPILGYIFDILGTLITEASCEQMKNHMRNIYCQNGENLSNIYSPGYCEWDFTDQELLFSHFPKNICGIQLTESLLMIPVKSISGIIGIGKNIICRKSICHQCSSKKCLYSNI